MSSPGDDWLAQARADAARHRHCLRARHLKGTISAQRTMIWTLVIGIGALLLLAVIR